MVFLGIFIVSLIAFIVINKRLDNKSMMNTRTMMNNRVMMNNETNIDDEMELERNKNNKRSDEIKGITRNPKSAYFVLGFFGFFTFFSLVFLITVLTSYKFDIGGFIITSALVTLGLVVMFFIVKSIIYNNRLYDHLKNGTILEKKAIITKFKYFEETEDNIVLKSGYIIIAYIGKQKYKSKKIKLLIFGAEGKDIDKAFCEKMGTPYSIKDPKFNDKYKRHIDAKKKEIDAQLVGLYEEYKQASRFKKNKIRKEITKLQAERVWLYPQALPYNGKMYYIGDEITVFVDPDNLKNYIM